MARVVVVQTSVFGERLFRDELKKLGILSYPRVGHSSGRVQVFYHSYRAEEFIVGGADQVLITGTFDGDSEAADRWVREMKSKNPALRVWLLSSMGSNDPELYERVFSKDDFHCFEKIAVAVKNYLKSRRKS